MKRYLAISVTLAALALPALVGAEQRLASRSVSASPAVVERESADASELTELLVRKGLITPQEQQTLTHRAARPATIDSKAWEAIFGSESYRGE